MSVRSSLCQIRRAIYEFAANPRYSGPALDDVDRRLGRYLTTISSPFYGAALL
jgi:hypothetical protein